MNDAIEVDDQSDTQDDVELVTDDLDRSGGNNKTEDEDDDETNSEE